MTTDTEKKEPVKAPETPSTPNWTFPLLPNKWEKVASSPANPTQKSEKPGEKQRD